MIECLTGLTPIYELWPVPSENAQVQGWTESKWKSRRCAKKNFDHLKNVKIVWLQRDKHEEIRADSRLLHSLNQKCNQISRVCCLQRNTKQTSCAHRCRLTQVNCSIWANCVCRWTKIIGKPSPTCLRVTAVGPSWTVIGWRQFALHQAVALRSKTFNHKLRAAAFLLIVTKRLEFYVVWLSCWRKHESLTPHCVTFLINNRQFSFYGIFGVDLNLRTITNYTMMTNGFTCSCKTQEEHLEDFMKCLAVCFWAGATGEFVLYKEKNHVCSNFSLMCQLTQTL